MLPRRWLPSKDAITGDSSDDVKRLVVPVFAHRVLVNNQNSRSRNVRLKRPGKRFLREILTLVVDVPAMKAAFRASSLIRMKTGNLLACPWWARRVCFTILTGVHEAARGGYAFEGSRVGVRPKGSGPAPLTLWRRSSIRPKLRTRPSSIWISRLFRKKLYGIPELSGESAGSGRSRPRNPRV